MKVPSFLFVLFWCCITIAESGTPTLLYNEAMRQYNNMQASNYSHDTFVNETAGIYEYDCNGFVSYSVKRLYLAAYSVIPKGVNSRPLSENYAAYFRSLPTNATGFWSRIDNVTLLQPGDVISWLKPVGTDGSNTGHTMICVGKGYWDSPARPGHFVVRVIDSSYYYHWADTRAPPIHGLGMGTIALVVNTSTKSLSPIGYRWRGSISGSTLYYTMVGLGRINLNATAPPTVTPSFRPSKIPTPRPTNKPTKIPTPSPTTKPTKIVPTRKPTPALDQLNTTVFSDPSNRAPASRQIYLPFVTMMMGLLSLVLTEV